MPECFVESRSAATLDSPIFSAVAYFRDKVPSYYIKYYYNQRNAFGVYPAENAIEEDQQMGARSLSNSCEEVLQPRKDAMSLLKGVSSKIKNLMSSSVEQTVNGV